MGGTTTTTTTTQYVEVAPTTATTYTTSAMPMTTTHPVTEVFTTAPLAHSVIGPNTHGVPENFPWLACDASCSKCHGTGYKKKMITRRWAPCKRCARKYGTDIHRVDLKNLPPIHSTECACPIGMTGVAGETIYTSSSTMPSTMISSTGPTMVATTAAGTMPGTTYTTLPAGF